MLSPLGPTECLSTPILINSWQEFAEQPGIWISLALLAAAKAARLLMDNYDQGFEGKAGFQTKNPVFDRHMSKVRFSCHFPEILGIWTLKVYITWLVVDYPSEKYEFVNGKDYPIYYGKIKNMFQTTKQIITIGFS